MNVVTHDQALTKATRLQLWSEHLERPIRELDGDPAEIVDSLWRPLAEQQLRRRNAGQPPSHRLLHLPHVSRRAEALRGPINGLFGDA